MKRLLVVIFLLCSINSIAQQKDRITPVKALYIYNFLTLTDFPNEKKLSEVVIMIPCNDGDSESLRTQLKDKYEGKKIGKRKIVISNSDDLTDLSKVSMIYVPKSCSSMAEKVKIAIGRKPILFVGSELKYGFPMVNMVIVDERVKFHINEAYFNRNNLKVNDRLIQYAEDVVKNEEEWNSVASKLEYELSENKNDKITIEKEDLAYILEEYNTKIIEIKELEKEFEVKKKEIENLENSIRSNSEKLALKEEELYLKNAELDSVRNVLEVQKRRVEIKTAELDLLTQNLRKQQSTYEGLTHEVENQKVFIDSMNNVLSGLGDSIQQNLALINDQNQKIKVKDDELVVQKETISEQQKQLFVSILFVILIAVGGIIVYRSYRQKKKANLILEEQRSRIETQKREIEHQHEEIMDSIAYAKRIQTAILPPPRLVKEYLAKSFVLYKPKDVVAGDFYWMEPVGDMVLFAAADCTGHGVPGAMVSVVCNGGLNRAVREFGLAEPGQILTKTRELVIQEFEKSEEEVKDGMDVALCSLGPASASGTSLEFAGAHNPLWVVRKGAEEVEEFKADKQPIGKYAEQKPFITHKVELKEGDTFYVFSDGFADQFGGDKGKKFKTANFKKLLISIQDQPIEKHQELIDQAFEDWRGKLEQLDDVCVIGVRV
ncbi:MAG: DUF4154 domain-containing protein [Crocinitomicaceae bacterium]|nr:DUF4154 domain-containing protein [Crocinitomicaceae bacterium]